MNVLMRADANANIGQGHIMRLLSLADALSDLDVQCAFACAASSYTEPITKRDYPVYFLPAGYDRMEEEVPALQDILRRFGADLIIVDSYYVTERYLEELRGKLYLVYMDDLSSFAYPVDLLVNYNIYASLTEYRKRYSGCSVKEPDYLLGTDYAPLRREFRNIDVRIPSSDVRNIAVSFGGADPMHMADSFLKTLHASDSRIKSAVVHLILGAMEPDLDAIRQFAETVPWLKLHINIRNMKELLLSCDMAVSAAGSTQYEICACQVPCINFSMADNQIPGGKAFGEKGIFCYAGDVRFRQDFYQNLLQTMEDLMLHEEKRFQMAAAERALIDGCGAERLAVAILDGFKSSRPRSFFS